MVPSVHSAWETFVTTKCTGAKRDAMQVYDKAMSTRLEKCQLPCESDDIRKMQKSAVDESMAVFHAEIVGVSSLSSDKYLIIKELMVRRKYWSTDSFGNEEREHVNYSFDRPQVLLFHWSLSREGTKEIVLRNAPWFLWWLDVHRILGSVGYKTFLDMFALKSRNCWFLWTTFYSVCKYLHDTCEESQSEIEHKQHWDALLFK